MNTQLITAKKSLKRLYIQCIVQKGKALTTIFIILLSAFAAKTFSTTYHEMNSFKAESKWENKYAVALKTYPSWFYYDKENSKILTSKIMSDSDKYKILELVDNKHKSYDSFSTSVNRLVYTSTKQKPDAFICLLLLAGWSAVIGVQIRTIFDFIGRICYKKNLVLTVWWPWYILRPVLGFLIGSLIIFLSKSHLLNTSIIDEDTSYIAISAIAGFGVVEVVQKLRLVSKTLFGGEDK